VRAIELSAEYAKADTGINYISMMAP